MAKINDDTVIYNLKPAENGTRDASIIGNGKVWASVLGRKSNEEVALNRSDLSYGGYTGVLQDVSDKFPSVRKLYSDGKIIDAEKVLQTEFSKKGYKPQVDKPLPIATFCLDFRVDGFITDYKRTTDMTSGEVETVFKHGGVQQTRSAFVAHNSDILAYNVTGKVNLVVSLKVPAIQLQNLAITYAGEFIQFAARSSGGLDYGFVARVVSSGLETKQDSIIIRNSDNVTIYVKTFNDSSRDVEFKKLKTELSGAKQYDKILSSSAATHEKLFNSYTLKLSEIPNQAQDFATLLSCSHNAHIDSALVTRLWNMGKYLSICGVSASDMSFFNTAQLLYCGSMSDILPDMVLKFFESYEKYVDDLKKNAARVYGMRGYFVPNVVSPRSALFGAADAGTMHFIASSALAANLFYKYYLTTGDAKILKSRIFPFMREVCNFYSDFLKLDSNGFYTTVPSYSPKSTPGNTIAGRALENFGFAINSAIDFLALDALLSNLIDAATVCGSNEGISMWQDMKTKLPSFGINDQGAIREYTNSAFIDRAQNLGTMHAYGLWPLKNISFNDKEVPYKPAVAVGAAERNTVISLRRASFNAVVARLAASWNMQDARSIATAAIQLSHAGLEGESAQAVRDVLLRLLTAVCTDSGLILNTDWRGGGCTQKGLGEFDVVANVGFTNVITECIVQSNPTTLRVLPSIFDALACGRITDVVTDFAAKVSIEWDTKQRHKCIVKIVPKISCKINIEVCQEFKKIKNKDLKMDRAINGIKGFALTAGKSVTLEFM
ncbi:MAG: glycoside hydrolase N-terminal domain-containing protein [Christensenellaceae bacterium]|jgi:alpha-L-fucosidase 2|nr:glycoside hydrolase N-terminal domain-containing protein [Christensenellaceae bacterium]